jgi:hypothetical protein
MKFKGHTLALLPFLFLLIASLASGSDLDRVYLSPGSSVILEPLTRTEVLCQNGSGGGGGTLLKVEFLEGPDAQCNHTRVRATAYFESPDSRRSAESNKEECRKVAQELLAESTAANHWYNIFSIRVNGLCRHYADNPRFPHREITPRTAESDIVAFCELFLP